MVEGFGSSAPVANNANKEGRSKNRRVEITAMAMAIPVPPEEKPEPTFVWNAWAEEGRVVKYKPVSYLKPKTEYSISLHLSNYTYNEKGVVSQPPSKQFHDFLKDQIENLNNSELKLTVVLIPDSDYFEVLQTPNRPMTINLDKIRKFKLKARSPGNALEILAKSPTTLPDFVFGSIDFKGITTRQREGIGYIGVAIWHDGVPVEDFSLPFLIASTERGDAGLTLSSQRKEMLSLNLRPPPAAALHFFGLNSAKCVGIFWTNEKPNEFSTWDLDRSPDEMQKFFLDVLIKKFNKLQPEETWRQYGIDFFNFIFPTRDIRDKMRKYVKRHINASPFGCRDLPSLFVRFTEIKDGMPFILPLGMMAIDFDEGRTEFLAFHFRIATPLKYGSYVDNSQCISHRILSMPVKDEELKKYYQQIDKTLQDGWKINAREELLEDLPSFKKWLNEEVNDNRSTAIIVMTHHGENTFADETGEVSSTDVRREFTQPSVAILNGCGTMEPTSTDFIKQFNKRGVMAVVATSTSVDKRMAADFLESLGKEIQWARQEGEKEITLSELFYRTQRRLYWEFDNHKANVLRYTLLGDGGLRLCVPTEGGAHE